MAATLFEIDDLKLEILPDENNPHIPTFVFTLTTIDNVTARIHLIPSDRGMYVAFPDSNVSDAAFLDLGHLAPEAKGLYGFGRPQILLHNGDGGDPIGGVFYMEQGARLWLETGVHPISTAPTYGKLFAYPPKDDTRRIYGLGYNRTTLDTIMAALLFWVNAPYEPTTEQLEKFHMLATNDQKVEHMSNAEANNLRFRAKEDKPLTLNERERWGLVAALRNWQVGYLFQPQGTYDTIYRQIATGFGQHDLMHYMEIANVIGVLSMDDLCRLKECA